MNNDREDHLNGGGRKPVVHKEIGPEDVANIIDFGVDSDEEFDLEDLEQADSNDEEMEPLQAAQFLVNAEGAPGNVHEEDNSDDMSESNLSVEEEGEQQAMEVPEDSDADEDSENVEQHVMEVGKILKDLVDYRTGELRENRLGAEGTPASIAKWINPHLIAGPSGSGVSLEQSRGSSSSGENRERNVASSSLGKDQELNVGSSGSGKGQEQDRGSSGLDEEHNPESSDSDEDQESNAEASGSGEDQDRDGGSSGSREAQDLNGGSSGSREAQDLNGGSSGSGEAQDLNGGSSGSGEAQEQNGGSSGSGEDETNGGQSDSSKDPVEQLHYGGLGDCGEIIERLQLEDEVQPDVYNPPVQVAEVGQELGREQADDMAEVHTQNEDSSTQKHQLVGMNGGPNSGEDPEDQQVKVVQMVGNEEAEVVPELVQEQVEVAEAVPEVNFEPDDEQYNLVEEIVQEQQVIPDPVPVEAVADDVVPVLEPTVAVEGQNNAVPEEDDSAEVPFDPFIHMA